MMPSFLKIPWLIVYDGGELKIRNQEIRKKKTLSLVFFIFIYKIIRGDMELLPKHGD